MKIFKSVLLDHEQLESLFKKGIYKCKCNNLVYTDLNSLEIDYKEEYVFIYQEKKIIRVFNEREVKTEYLINGNGLIYEVNENSSDSLKYKLLYFYDDNNNLIRREKYYKGEKIRTIHHSYDNQGRKIGSFMNNETLKNNIIYEDNKYSKYIGKNIVGMSSLNKDGTIRETNSICYDKYKKNNFDLINLLYEYDENGNKIKITRRVTCSKTNKIKETNIFHNTYDDENKLLKQEIINNTKKEHTRECINYIYE